MQVNLTIRKYCFSKYIRVQLRFVGLIPCINGVEICRIYLDNLLVLEKGCNVLSHPNTVKDVSNCLVACTSYNLKDEVYMLSNPDGTFRPLYLINRLDSATSGLVVVSLNKALADTVKQLFRERKVRKQYIAVTFGHYEKTKSVWKDRIEVLRTGSEVRMQASGEERGDSAKIGETHVSVLHRGFMKLEGKVQVPYSVLELHPVTGYTHQLRYQCAIRNCPIIGDKTYGNFTLNKKLKADKGAAFEDNWLFHRCKPSGRLFLHCHQLDFTFSYNKTDHKVQVSSNRLSDMVPQFIFKK